MFQVNEYVVYGNLGICQIRAIRPARLGDAEPMCLVLKSLADPGSTFYIPTDSADLLQRMRPVLTRAEILAMIEAMPGEAPIWVKDERERSREFAARVQSGDCRELARVIKSLYQERARKRERGKSLTSTDARLMSQAERMLYDEFAFALGIDREAVVPFILEHLPLEDGTPAPAAAPIIDPAVNA